MNVVTKKIIEMIAPMVIKELLDSIFNEKVLTGFRDEVVMFLRTRADRTDWKLDDELVEIIVKTIMAPGKFTEETRKLCKVLREYITHNRVKWDDMLFLPVIDRIEALSTFSKPEEEPKERAEEA